MRLSLTDRETEITCRWMESGRSSEIRSLDLDRSDNLSEAVIKKFIEMHHLKLEGLVLTGMGQISDMLFITELNKTKVSFGFPTAINGGLITLFRRT